MRACFTLLLAVIVLLATTNAVSGSTIKLRASQNPIQVETTNGRVLRGDVKTEQTVDTDGEERNAVTNAISKLGAKYKNAKLVGYLKMQSHAVYTERFAEGLMKKGITPDKVFEALKLSVRNNRWSPQNGNKPAYILWLDYLYSYTKANPNWKPKISPSDIKKL